MFKIKHYLKEKHCATFLILKCLKKREMHLLANAFLNSENPCFVCLERHNEASFEKTVFVIEHTSEFSGFTGLLRRTLDGLYFFDQYKMKDAEVVVSYPKDRALYKDVSIKETENTFEYYFEQPFGVGEADLENAKIVIHLREKNIFLARKMNNDVYHFSPNYNDVLTDMLKKYLHFNEKTKTLIEKEIVARKITKRTLGVHIRGTDFKENYRGHPVYVPVERYIVAIDNALKTNLFDKIFLATDDNDILAQMICYYGTDMLGYAKDINRATGTEGVHTIVNEDRKSNPYLMGLEVLYDICSLSQCGGIISSLSQVPYLARIYKNTKNEVFLFDEIIDLGINRSGRSFRAHARRKEKMQKRRVLKQ